MALNLTEGVRTAAATVGLLVTAVTGVGWFTSLHSTVQGAARAIERVELRVEDIDERQRALEISMAALAASPDTCPRSSP